MQPLLLPQRQLTAGFTGTRDGLTPRAKKALVDLLFMVAPRQLQHGDCVGADAEVHDMALTIGIQLAIRPPDNPRLRAFCLTHNGYVVVHPEKPYLERNHDIVNDTHYLIACPSTMRPVVRSGTWATIRYAVAHDKVVFLVFPDGRLDRMQPDG